MQLRSWEQRLGCAGQALQGKGVQSKAQICPSVHHSQALAPRECPLKQEQPSGTIHPPGAPVCQAWLVSGVHDTHQGPQGTGCILAVC